MGVGIQLTEALLKIVTQISDNATKKDCCNRFLCYINRSTGEMKPLDDSPLDHIKIDQDRSSFMNGSEADCEEFDDLPPPPPKIDSAGNPYVEYPEDSRTSTPPPSPGMSPLYPPLRASTPDNGTVIFVTVKFSLNISKLSKC